MNSYRIKDVARINDQILPENTDPDFNFRYIDISSVNELGQIQTPDEETTFASAPSRARRIARPGSVVVSTVRTYLRAIAPVPTTSDPIVFSTGFAVLTPKDGVDGRYLAYYCRSQHFIDEVVARSVGVSYPAINPSEIGNIPVQLPPLELQCQVADFLDAETACIDRVLQIREAQQGLLTEKRDAEISEILIPGILTHPCRLGPWPWLPDLPPGTPLVRLGYLARLQNGVTVDANRKVGDAVTLPYVRVANVQAGRLDLREIKEITVTRDAAKQAMLRVGDVLMTEGGDLDKLGRGTVWRGELPECLHQNHVFAIRTDPEYLDPEYLALMTQTAHGRCYFESTGSRTTNLASTNSTKILSFPVPLTCIEDQRSRVRQIRRLLDQVQVAKSLLHSQSALLRERRQVLITAAVTGQFDVSTASGRSGLRKRPSGLRQAGIRRDE